MLGVEGGGSHEKTEEAMKKTRLAVAALVLGSCVALGAVPASANTTEPVANQNSISAVKGNEASGFGCFLKFWFGTRTWCNRY